MLFGLPFISFYMVWAGDMVWAGGGRVLEEVSVWKKLKKSRIGGTRCFSLNSEVKWYSAMVCVEEQFWMIRCGLLVQETVKENDDMVCYTLLEVVGFLGCNDSVLVLNGMKR